MKVDVALGSRSYTVLIEPGLLGRAGPLLAPFARNQSLVVVSDEQVWRNYGGRLRDALRPISVEPVLVPPGEGSKSWPVLTMLVERLLALGVERSDHIVAFGGGMVGDLAGFAAAIVKRGCGLIQIPTTLLAQVDSSIGGKTAINAAAGKNLVGAFHQPALVLIDADLLGTLDSRQLRAGYAEIVKYALIEDAPFFAWLEQNGEALLAGDREAQHHAIATSVRGKALIVAEDERELSGRRALLNLGHTFGHALEAAGGFAGLLHGEAVALGMVLAFDLSVERGLCPPADAERVRRHLASVRLPVDLGEVRLASSGAVLVKHMLDDKKVASGRLSLILARGIGEAFLETNVDPRAIEQFLDRQRSR